MMQQICKQASTYQIAHNNQISHNYKFTTKASIVENIK